MNDIHLVVLNAPVVDNIHLCFLIKKKEKNQFLSVYEP